MIPENILPSQIEAFLNSGLTCLLVVFIGYIIMRIFLRITKKALGKSHLDPALHVFIINTLKVILWVVIIITALTQAGVSTNTFITVLAASGAAVALALRDSLSNFAGGVLILITKPFSKGDHIDNMSISGKVEAIDLLYTTLKTFDNKVITIPNGALANSTVINNSKEPVRRVDTAFKIGLNDDFEKAVNILKDIASSDERIHKSPAPFTAMTGIGDGYLTVECKVWSSTDDYWDIKYLIEEKAKKAFDEAGISIPYTQMDVHMKQQ